MAKSVLSIVIETLKKGDADKETIKTLKNVQQGLKDLGVVAGAVAGIYVALDQTIGASVRAYMAYTDQVRQLRDVTGDTAANTSRLIQVTDDYKISAEELAKAQKQLATQGKTLSVETLAALSDEYQKLNTGSERQLFLTKEFGGRVGQAFAEMMTKGGDAIRAKNDAIEAGLILSERDLEQTRQYQIDLDNLNDTLLALKVIGSQHIFPYLLADLNALNEILSKGPEEWARNLTIVKIALGEIDPSQAKGFAKDIQEAIGEIPPELQDATQAYKDFMQVAKDAGAYFDERAQLEKDLALARKQGYSELGTKIKDIKGKIEDLDDAHHTAMLNWIADAYQAQLASDGLFSDDDMNKVLAYKREMGLLTTEEYNAAMQALALKKALESMPTNINITITEWLNLVQTGHTGKGQTTGRSGTVGVRASGGQLEPAWTLVGDAPGGQLTPYSELISPTGYVFNARETRQLIAAGIHPRALYQGGVGYGDDPLTIGTSPANAAYNEAYYAPYLSTGGSGGETRKRRAGAAATATVSTAVNTAAVALRAASQGITEQTAQAAEIGAQGNQISKQILAAIDALPERLAAKLAQGRL